MIAKDDSGYEPDGGQLSEHTELEHVETGAIIRVLRLSRVTEPHAWIEVDGGPVDSDLTTYNETMPHGQLCDGQDLSFNSLNAALHDGRLSTVE